MKSAIKSVANPSIIGPIAIYLSTNT